MNDLRGKLGSLFMATFGIIAFIRWNHSRELFFILLSVRNFIAAFFFLKRSEVKSQVSRVDSVIAYVSTLMPLVFLSQNTTLTAQSLFIVDLCSIAGFTLVAWATIDLGISLGVAPAKRGETVSTGVYRLFDHPMYLGYIIAQAGWLIINPLNAGIFAVSVVLMFYRGKREIALLK